MGKPENQIEQYLVEKAKLYNFLCYKFMSGQNGVPDRILVGNGYTLFVEIKKPNGILDALQVVTLRKLRKVKAEAFWVDTKDQIDYLFSIITNMRPHESLSITTLMEEYKKRNE